MELWQKQLIRSLFHYSAKRMNIELAFIVKHPHLPARLYKYRQFTPNHLDALSKNVLWMSSPDRFNDPYDAAVSFDTDRFLIEEQSVHDFIASAKEMDRVLKAGGTWQPKKLVHPVQQGTWRQRIMTELLADANIPHKEEFARAISEFMKKQAEDGVKRMSDWFRQGFSVLSLSENVSSTLMWSHYSDSHRGFVIEYDFASLGYGDLRRRLCFPVFYTKKLRDATRYMARSDMTDYNNLFGQYMCLIKQDQWSYEREWRIIHAIGPSHANAELSMPEPSAIILGAQVKQADEDTMAAVCRARSIPLKRMVQRPGRFDLELTDVPL